ncbi:MAG: sugar phosphate nucleotidyltransferase [Armatimonadota bacterium]
MQAIILAGGKPTQLHSPSTDCPKPMVPLFDRPVMEHTIQLLARHGITDIIVATSHHARDIADYFGDGTQWGVSVRYSIESEPLGTAGAIKQARNMIDGRFLVIHGDIATDFDLKAAIERHEKSHAIATLLLGESEEPTQFGIVGQDNSGRVTRILEKPKSSEAFSTTISTGIYVFEPEVISCIPYDQSCDFARHVFPAMLTNQEQILGLSLPGYWCDVGNLNHYRKLHFDALVGALKLDLHATHIGEGIWIGERVVIDPSVELAAPVYIGAGATIGRGARLGERAVIGEGAVIDDYACVTRSVVGRKSFVGRNSRISNCIIGGGYSVSEGDSIADKSLVSHISYEPPVTQTKPTLPIVKPKKQTAESHQEADRVPI